MSTTAYFRNLDRFFDHLVLEATAKPHVIIGPLHWVASDGREGRQWLLRIAVGGRHDHIIVPSDADPKEFRDTLVAQLQQRLALIVHDAECPHCMATLSATLWPSERTQDMRASFETSTH